MYKQRGFFDHQNYVKKKEVETPWIFQPEKLHRRKTVETTWIFRPSKLHQKSMWKKRRSFDHRNYVKKVRGNDVQIRRN